MGRLTRMIGKTHDLLNSDVKLLDCLEKLGQLEDIEEELGIDLVTLFKALKDGAWFKDYETNEIHYYDIENEDYGLYSTGDNWFIDWAKCMAVCGNLKDYGKTWALTREELENE